MLLGESEGHFSYEEWNEACQMAEDACCGEEDEDEGGVGVNGSVLLGLVLLIWACLRLSRCGCVCVCFMTRFMFFVCADLSILLD